jgi:hypothetical protein
MDDIVRAALAKWPNVPDCYGWLGMDARGDFYMRDDRCQAAGAFADWRSEPRARGSRIEHDKLLAFIHRNYAQDENSRAYYFQNGPQRVYVELELTPFVWRILSASESLVLQFPEHAPQAPRALYTCEQGLVYADTALGLGVIHTQDMAEFAERLDALEAAGLALQTLSHSALSERFSYLQSPQRERGPHAH